MTGMTMTAKQKALAIETLTEALRIVQALPESRACGSCDYFDKGHCRKWGAPVPEEAQAAGCDEWIEDIPF